VPAHLSRTVLLSGAVVSSLSLMFNPLAATSATEASSGTASSRTGGPVTGSARPAASAVMLSPKAARPVQPRVEEYRVAAPAPGHDVAVSTPRPSTGYGVVGATWAGAVPAGLRIAVRTRTGDVWSSWTRLSLDAADHGPDPGTAEARTDRPASDPLVVGDVDLVQMRATSRTGHLPRALQLAVVDPGASPADDDPVSRTGFAGQATASVVGQAPRPKIRARGAWGANERLRTRRPTFGTVRAGFVHHTVNTNGYRRAQVPAIIRGIYAFHTQVNGWSDIGYNFLVDRFGRIWEGRFGGPARDVIGAHTLGFNDVAFAMSAIGNFQTARPSRAMVRAFGRLMGWKLGINNVRAGDMRQFLHRRSFRAISGHRDAGATLCPGVHLYKRIRVIRQIAVGAQRGTAAPAPQPAPPDDGGPGPGAALPAP
jgi:N-acetylmuramoyl-L-alanine amidase